MGYPKMDGSYGKIPSRNGCWFGGAPILGNDNIQGEYLQAPALLRLQAVSVRGYDRIPGFQIEGVSFEPTYHMALSENGVYPNGAALLNHQLVAQGWWASPSDRQMATENQRIF